MEDKCPRLLINQEKVAEMPKRAFEEGARRGAFYWGEGNYRDALYLGDCDEGVREMCRGDCGLGYLFQCACSGVTVAHLLHARECSYTQPRYQHCQMTERVDGLSVPEGAMRSIDAELGWEEELLQLKEEGDRRLERELQEAQVKAERQPSEAKGKSGKGTA